MALRFQIFNDDCDNSLASGYAATLFTERDVDVIFGPVCNSGKLFCISLTWMFITVAAIVGSMGKFYNKPIMTWGLVNSYDLTNSDDYPTISTIVGTSRALGQALIQVMQNFDWKQFAFLYATNDPRNRCSYVKDDIETVLNDESDIFISYQRAVPDVTLSNVKEILNTVSTKARSMKF